MKHETATAREIAGAVRARTVSAEEVTRAVLARLDASDPKLHAFLQVFHAEAVDHARAIDARIARGDTVGPLAGVPIALKDNLCLAWGRTTAASRILENYESPFTAAAVQRLLDAGAIVIGKTNCDEFAMGSSGENSAFGPTRNPWDATRVPGGSSSGSAAAVAAGIVPITLGSDTGGSIRQPAGHCGVVGLKPTYGRVSRYGLIAFASSLDQIGPLTRTVDDAALALGVMAGIDPLDATSADRPAEDFTRGLDNAAPPAAAGLVIGVPRQAVNSANHLAVAAALDAARKAFTALGARVIDVDLPHAAEGIAAYYVVASAEASSNLARYDGVRFGRRAKHSTPQDLEAMYSRSRAEGFGAEVQRRIMLGTYVLSSGYYDQYYATALKVRRTIKGDYDAAFAAGCAALLLPSSPAPAFRLGEKTSDPLAMYLEDVYTVGVNLAGLPAITIPGGFAEVDGSRLPVGLQLVGPAWEEGRLLRIAGMLEHSRSSRAATH
ncbi:MAG: Asp-tRNA(Asn)/Glu-tRNA(Gln) amidotransferase subunit GatA [Phycisphaerales bacterium]